MGLALAGAGGGAGHTHCGYQTTLDGITFYTTNPSGNTLGHGCTGIYRVEVNKKGIEVTFVPTTDD